MHCFSKKSVIKPGDFMIITTKKLTLTAILCGLLTASVLPAGCAFPASNLNTAAPSESAEGPETDYTVVFPTVSRISRIVCLGSVSSVPITFW